MLIFHEGDNFVLSLNCVLKSMGGHVEPGEILRIMVMFRDSRGLTVHFFDEEATDGAAQFVFSPTVSEKFTKGRYEYDVGVVTGTVRDTVAASLPCVVI